MKPPPIYAPPPPQRVTYSQAGPPSIYHPQAPGQKRNSIQALLGSTKLGLKRFSDSAKRKITGKKKEESYNIDDLALEDDGDNDYDSHTDEEHEVYIRSFTKYKDRVRVCFGLFRPSRGLRAYWMEIAIILLLTFAVYTIIYILGVRQRQKESNERLRAALSVPLSQGGI